MNDLILRRYHTADGLTLVGDVGGDENAPAVVLLHGGGQTRHSWSNAMTKLIERGYHVVNYDARGHGDSEWSPSGDYSIPSLASDLQTVLATLRGPVALVGASMGGITSFYAVGSGAAPGAGALVLVDIAIRPARSGVEKIWRFMTGHHQGFGSLEEAADAVAAYNPDRPRPSTLAGLMKNLRQREDGRLYWHWDPRLMEQRPSSEPPSPVRYLESVSAGVTIPTLLVRGGNSDIVDDESVSDMIRRVPQTEVFEVPGAGHMVAGDRNDAFNEGVFAFLARHHPLQAPLAPIA